jgi:hypothetical protein
VYIYICCCLALFRDEVEIGMVVRLVCVWMHYYSSPYMLVHGTSLLLTDGIVLLTVALFDSASKTLLFEK